MKTKTKIQKFNPIKGFYAMVVVLMLFSAGTIAQQQDSTQTLFKSGVKVSELWTPEIKINSIQGDIGTLIGIYGGALINRTLLVGFSGGVNLGHPRVNYGYFGGIGQYIHNPSRMMHWSGQLLIAYGTTKDYESPKSGPFDNFWNISGESFFLMEPGVNLELNLSSRLTLVAGVSYRYVSGLDDTNENVSITHVTNEDMSGINFNVGLKFGKKQKE